MKRILSVDGMSCGHCKKAVEDAVGRIDGVKRVEVDLENKRVEVQGENLMDHIISKTIEEAGYDVVSIQ